MKLETIISGGQTGADRAALDVALEAEFPCGGWCPKGRTAEDGCLPMTYPLRELSKGGYRHRTIKNVEEADGTAIFYFGRPTGGTELTLATCIRLSKPYQLIDALEVTPNRGSIVLARFIDQCQIAVLNVAGPRESSAPGVYDYVRVVIESLLKEERNGA
jgi:hypothetical protein